MLLDIMHWLYFGAISLGVSCFLLRVGGVVTHWIG